MINAEFGRYIPTIEVKTEENGKAKNVFRSEVVNKEYVDLTSAFVRSKDWLDHHFGFVLLYHNGRLIQRLCNYKLFYKTFKDLNIEIELINHIGV